MIETSDPRILQLEQSMVAEASTLEFPVGVFPRTFLTTDGHEFELFREEYEREDLVAVKYVDKKTKGVLTVFND